MKWSEVQDNCEQRLKDLVERREKGLVRDKKGWNSLVQSNEDIRKLAIEAQGRRYGGKFLKIENGSHGITAYSFSGE